MSHTPGPWALGQKPHEQGTMIDIDAVGMRQHGAIAVAVWRMEQEERSPDMEANAHLIAAAPELLEALIAMEREKPDYMTRNNLGDPSEETTNRMARAAIAKAKGEVAQS